MELEGKVALVTGGSGDIGGAIAKALARSGADIAFSFVGNAEGARTTAAAIAGMGRKARAMKLDQRDLVSIDECAKQVLAEFGRLDILINNAAWNIGIPFQDLAALTPDVWDRVLETNVRGPFLLVRALEAELRRHKSGRIINVASLAGLAPTGSSLAYAVSKAALVHLTRCLAVALAPEVTVNCIAPGLVDGTRMAERLPEDVKRRARSAPLLGRTGSIDDVANQVLAFCRADSVTGQVLVVDGGLPIGMR